LVRHGLDVRPSAGTSDPLFLDRLDGGAIAAESTAGPLSLHGLGDGLPGDRASALVLAAITVILVSLRLVPALILVLLVALVLRNSSGGNQREYRCCAKKPFHFALLVGNAAYTLDAAQLFHFRFEILPL
jgi:hypothetical protein